MLKEEYRDNKFEDCFDVLYKRYTQVRRLRRDGNCFYRAFLFQVFEHFIFNKDSKQYDTFIQAIDKSKKELMELGYDEIVIEDFHDLFLTETKNLKSIDPSKAHEHLMKVLCNREEANYLIMHARFMTACHLK